MVLFFVPHVTGIARNQEVNCKTMKAKNCLPLPKSKFCWDPKNFAAFFGIGADVLRKMSLNSVYFFFIYWLCR
jgi:hypothetical protein